MAGSAAGDLLGDTGDMAALVRAVGATPGRHLAVPGTLNFRDVGGYPAGGGTTRWRRLLRSDGLHRLGPGTAGLLAALRLRTVLDLRTSVECDIAPSPLDELAGQGALTMHISLIGEDLGGVPADLGEIYDYIVDERGAQIAAAIRALARPGGLPALVHCSAGKDRTGIVVALALAAVGVPDQIIAADYALSSLYLDPQHTPTIGRVREDTGLGDQLTAALLASPPELMARVLARARKRGRSHDRASHDGNGVAAYLAAHGVTCAELTALRSALVTRGGDRDQTDEADQADVAR
jgi:protein-tyrosine phosphatase